MLNHIPTVLTIQSNSAQNQLQVKTQKANAFKPPESDIMLNGNATNQQKMPKNSNGPRKLRANGKVEGPQVRLLHLDSLGAVVEQKGASDSVAPLRVKKNRNLNGNDGAMDAGENKLGFLIKKSKNNVYASAIKENKDKLKHLFKHLNSKKEKDCSKVVATYHVPALTDLKPPGNEKQRFTPMKELKTDLTLCVSNAKFPKLAVPINATPKVDLFINEKTRSRKRLRLTESYQHFATKLSQININCAIDEKRQDNNYAAEHNIADQDIAPKQFRRHMKHKSETLMRASLQPAEKTLLINKNMKDVNATRTTLKPIHRKATVSQQLTSSQIIQGTCTNSQYNSTSMIMSQRASIDRGCVPKLDLLKNSMLLTNISKGIADAIKEISNATEIPYLMQVRKTHVNFGMCIRVGTCVRGPSLKITKDKVDAQYKISSMRWYTHNTSIKGFIFTYKHISTSATREGTLHGIETPNSTHAALPDGDDINTIYSYSQEQELLSLRFVSAQQQIVQVGPSLELFDDFGAIHAAETCKKRSLARVSSYFDQISGKFRMLVLKYY